MDNVIRRCRFAPYRKGMGPTFTLVMSDTGKYDSRGQTRIHYHLTMRDGQWMRPASTVVLFDGSDFSGSPMHADDSDATVASLMWFLTLRPGDTDEDYFASYTAEQLKFCEEYAETLSCYITDRFGEY